MARPTIDFQRLLREAKQTSRQSKEPIEEKVNPDEIKSAEKPLPPWNLENSTVAHPNLNLVRLCSNPPSLQYQDDFLPSEYANALQQWLLLLPDNPDPRKAVPNAWTTLYHAKRRVCWMYSSGDRHFPEPLQCLVNAITTIFSEQQPPNHILINDYDATTGILPHTDGPAYAPCTVTVSIGYNVIFSIGQYQLVLRHGSIVTFSNHLYHDKHSISNDAIQITDDSCLNAPPHTIIVRSGRRISLTIRHKYIVDQF